MWSDFIASSRDPNIDMASSRKSIYGALVANLLIAITKFIAGGISNSASMFSEGIHSLVDTGNQLLLLLGIKRSKKPADAKHPFGYGRELYFWSFIVSILIFGLGGGLSVYQGISHIIHPEPLGEPTLNYIVLIVSLVFEGISFVIAIREFNVIRGDMHWWKVVVTSKDPSTFLVLFEDAAALLGLLIVLICLLIAHSFGIPWLDGLASLLVGLVLVAVSGILARESRSLLMGESISPETKGKVNVLVGENPHVRGVKEIISTYQSPTEVVLLVMVVFRNDLTTQTLNTAIADIRDTIQKNFKLIRYVFVQPIAETSN